MYGKTYPCSVCHGSGKQNCSQCRGAGKTDCTGCNRTGKVWLSYANQWSTCHLCNGSGYRWCFSCSSGKVNCSSCYGKGHHINYAYVEPKPAAKVEPKPAAKSTTQAATPETKPAATPPARKPVARVATRTAPKLPPPPLPRSYPASNFNEAFELGGAFLGLASRVIIVGGLLGLALLTIYKPFGTVAGAGGSSDRSQPLPSHPAPQSPAKLSQKLADAPDQKRIEPGTSAANGVWSGRYLCNQGWTGLTLRVSGEAHDVSATAEFFALPSNPRVSSGRWLLKGQFDNATKRLRLRPFKELQMPAGYSMIGFDAHLDRARGLTGNVTGGHNCGAVILGR